MVKGNKLLDTRKINSSHKNVNNSLVKIGCAATIAALLNFASPVDAKAQCFGGSTKEKIEQVAEFDMLNSIQQKTGVKIPNGYEEKVREFIEYSKIFENKDAREFTENFIVKEMKNDWGISKRNQLFFICYSIFVHTVNEDIYDGEDGDNERLEEFESAVEIIDACGERYVNEFKGYMEGKSAEYDKQSAEYDKQSAEYAKQSAEYAKQSAEYAKQSAEYAKQSAEYDKQSAEAEQELIKSLNDALFAVIDFYDSYNTLPDSERLAKFKPKVKDIIPICKKYGIDYKAFFLKKLGDEKEVDKLLKLFEIE